MFNKQLHEKPKDSFKVIKTPYGDIHILTVDWLLPDELVMFNDRDYVRMKNVGCSQESQ